jgi:3-dehydroquinate synthase
VPDGDAAKSLAVIEDLYRWMLELGLNRSDTLVGLGGGALTDAAGFAAATYLRGVEAIYVPTTVLGAVDAAIGGKTGVNLDGKNLVGAFRHPARVVIDVDVLDRLPDEVKRGGLAEALKAGLIGDPALVGLLEAHGPAADLAEVVRRAVAVKAAVVGRDFTEQGERAHLNYGHTIGHAVEVAAGLGHGEAVAIGMVAAGRAAAVEVGFTDEARQTAAIAGLGLPVGAPGLGRDEVLALVGRDKKRDAAGLRMVLLEAIGSPLVRHVGSATVGAALDAIDIA